MVGGRRAAVMRDEQLLNAGPTVTCAGTGDESPWGDDERGVLVEPAEPWLAPERPREGSRRYYEF
jgi:hypothetical protein